MKNISLEKSHTKCGTGVVLIISKKSKFSISWGISLNIYTVYFYCTSKLRHAKIY